METDDAQTSLSQLWMWLSVAESAADAAGTRRPPHERLRRVANGNLNAPGPDQNCEGIASLRLGSILIRGGRYRQETAEP